MARVLAPVAVLVVLAAGGWLILSKGPGPDWVKIALTVAFFFLVSFAIARVTERRPDLKLPLRVTFLVVAVAAGGFYVWDSHLRPKSEKNEDVVMAEARASGGTPQRDQNVELAAGSFRGLEGHSAEGDVSVVKLADGQGQKLVFEDFEVTKGPDLRVYLVEGDGEVSGDNFEDVGALKAERGRFQYAIDDVDIGRHRTVVIWCRAFSVPFGEAKLEDS